MAEINTGDLNAAILLFSGLNISSFPDNDKERVVSKFGEEKANCLISKIDDIFLYIETLEINWERMDLVAASRWAAKEAALKFPFLDGESLRAIEWMCAFGWK